MDRENFSTAVSDFSPYKDLCVNKLDEHFSGSKSLSGRLTPEEVKHYQGMLAHNAQLQVEELLLRGHGISEEMITQLKHKWGDKKKWLDLLATERTELNVIWGSARNSLLDEPEVQVTLEVLEQLTYLMAQNKESIIHGSSSTGMMGKSDSTFFQHAKKFWQSRWEAACRIYTIPLHWSVSKKEMREIAAKNCSREYRCPPHMKISDRTGDFFVKKPRRVITMPGGLGTLFEVAFLLISWQLRKLLLTVATGWETCPKIFLVDFVDQQGNYFWDGLKALLYQMVKFKVIEQSDIEALYVIRVGLGQDQDAPNGSQKGPRVKYFPGPTEAAAYIYNS